MARFKPHQKAHILTQLRKAQQAIQNAVDALEQSKVLREDVDVAYGCIEWVETALRKLKPMMLRRLFG